MVKEKKTNTYSALGIMSGTSLDGLDLALCRFIHKGKHWKYHIEAKVTLEYPEELRQLLANAQNMDGEQLMKFHQYYGKYIGKVADDFLKKTGLHCDLIASHGHTIYHNPDEALTFQLGDGKQIANLTGIETVYDFRSQDIALGGQGAPLVPIGDKLLFNSYKLCLNLGGFSNISFDFHGKRLAFDPSPVNFILNSLVRPFGKSYDEDGKIGKNGQVDSALLEKLNKLEYYKIKGPKSLGREWVEDEFLPILEEGSYSPLVVLRTVYEHIAEQITESIKKVKKGKILVTGGGAHNSFLMKLIQEKTHHEIIKADQELVDFKEALIFAFLGVLRVRNEVNCLSSVTGAIKDHSSGTIVNAPESGPV